MSPSIDPAALMEGWKVVGVGPGFWTPGQERGWITSLLTLPNPIYSLQHGPEGPPVCF